MIDGDESSGTDSMDSSDRPAIWAGPIPPRIGHYEVEGEIGRGGMGIVYRGHDTRLDRAVAIKVLPDVLATEASKRARFQREAKLLALVNHAHIASIYAIEQVDDRSYLILEYVPGQTLAERLVGGPLPLAEALRLTRQVAQAIQAAHERGVIHRDLKPANIRVTPEGVAKVLDFGLARLEGESREALPGAPEITEEGSVLGTTAYMSPEQLLGQHGDQRVDVWAFGCVLFECLTGGRVWGLGTTSERVRAIHATEPPWSELPEDTPERVRGLLRGCLEKERSRRLRDMDEVLRAIEVTLDELAGRRQEPSGATSLLLVVAPERAGNLTRHFTSFLGREQELEELRQLMNLTRLVTLSGTGGTGKTRLAVELAASMRSQYRDGVWLADLAPLTDDGLVAQTVASILGVKEAKAEPLSETLASHLEQKSLLLILDNCEHVLPACARLVTELLPRCPGLTLLATSREPLAVEAERAYVLQPLGAPPREGRVTLEYLERYESMRLFVERARVVAPDFEVSEENVAAVAQICARLDGLPLAVELAAARVRMLSVEQIAARLGDRFRLLKSTDRSAPARHKTLRALIDWSYDALEEEEKALMRRLSLFAGGFSLEAAEAVCSWGEVAEEDVLDLLTVLLDRSLVTVEKRGRAVRYRLLETVRDYGRQRLEEAGEAERMAGAFLNHYLALATEAAAAFKGGDQAFWLDRLEEEQDNLRKALQLSQTSPEGAQRGLRLAAGLCEFWRNRGYASEGRELLEALIASGHAAIRDETRARALHAAGRLAFLQGDLREARQRHEEALALSRELDLGKLTTGCLVGLAEVLRSLGDNAAARLLLEEALEWCRTRGERRIMVDPLTALANLAHDAGDLPTARSAYRECLETLRETGDRLRTALTLSNLAVVEMADGKLQAARALLEESLVLREKLNNRRGLIRTKVNLALLAIQLGEIDEARGLYLEVMPMAEELGDKEAMGVVSNNLANMALRMDRPGEARPWVVRGIVIARQMGHSSLRLNLLENCARIELGRGYTERAALLKGATEVMRAGLEAPVDLEDVAVQESLLRALEAMLGSEGLAELLARGGRMSVEEAIDLALEEPSES